MGRRASDPDVVVISITEVNSYFLFLGMSCILYLAVTFQV
jgi:hypothetical protein